MGVVVGRRATQMAEVKLKRDAAPSPHKDEGTASSRGRRAKEKAAWPNERLTRSARPERCVQGVQMGLAWAQARSWKGPNRADGSRGVRMVISELALASPSQRDETPVEYKVGGNHTGEYRQDLWTGPGRRER